MTIVHLGQRDGGVRVLTLDDPQRRNALSRQLQVELGAAVESVAKDRAARALVVTGAGPAFCAGADLPEVFAGIDNDVAELRSDLRRVYASFLRLRELAIPTIAAIRGAAVGAGVNLAMSCDIRLGAPDTSFGLTFTRLGLHPGGGCTAYLVKALDRQRALDLLLGGHSISAAQALEWGLLVDVVDDPFAEALVRARTWAEMDPYLVRDVVQASKLADSSEFAETVEFEAWAQAASASRSVALRDAIARFR